MATAPFLAFGLETSGASLSRPGFPHRTPLKLSLSRHVLRNTRLEKWFQTNSQPNLGFTTEGHPTFSPSIPILLQDCNRRKQLLEFFSPNYPGRKERTRV